MDLTELNINRTDNLISLDIVPGLPRRRLWNIRHNSSISSLTITACPEYNRAMVECVAGFLGSTLLEIASALMVIQGTCISDTLN